MSLQVRRKSLFQCSFLVYGCRVMGTGRARGLGRIINDNVEKSDFAAAQRMNII